jgi:NAD(P)-dependent dehydrogenase (short-subunit alcohol dehydrogenase family)
VDDCHNAVGIVSHYRLWLLAGICVGVWMRADKTAIVTGSTSGIGLGIATALAGASTNILLDGFGNAEEIKKIVSDLAAQPTQDFVEVSPVEAPSAFLCSDKAASITGALLPIDGGSTAY